MRAAFSFSFAIDSQQFDLKAYATVDESKAEIKRERITRPVAGAPKAADVSGAKVSRVEVSSSGMPVSPTETVKGITRGEEFIEISDDDLADLRLSNGEFRPLGFMHNMSARAKGQVYEVVPAKDTKESRKRFLALLWALVEDGGVLLIEGSVRGKQRLYGLVEDQISHTLLLQEFAYAEEEVDTSSLPRIESLSDLGDEIPEIDLSSLPVIEKIPSSSYIVAFHEKYGVE